MILQGRRIAANDVYRVDGDLAGSKDGVVVRTFQEVGSYTEPCWQIHTLAAEAREAPVASAEHTLGDDDGLLRDGAVLPHETPYDIGEGRAALHDTRGVMPSGELALSCRAEPAVTVLQPERTALLIVGAACGAGPEEYRGRVPCPGTGPGVTVDFVQNGSLGNLR